MSSSGVDSDSPGPWFHHGDYASADDVPPSAYARLAEEVGDNMARMLVAALANAHGVRGSSSP
jgi:hypothetical protein